MRIKLADVKNDEEAGTFMREAAKILETSNLAKRKWIWRRDRDPLVVM